MSRILITRRGRAFGDAIMPSLIVDTLNDAGVECFFYNKHSSITDLVDCKKTYDYNPTEDRLIYFHYAFVDYPTLYHESLSYITKELGITNDIQFKRNHVPVKFEQEYTKQYDVVICSKTGNWTPYKNWNGFDKLKLLLDEQNISFIDLSEKSIYNNNALNCINASKLFLSLDTGISHYASQISNGKTMIIQSGYTTFGYWAGLYDFDFIENKTDCSPCILKSNCQHSHKCMTEITPEQVLKKIKKNIGVEK